MEVSAPSPRSLTLIIVNSSRKPTFVRSLFILARYLAVLIHMCVATTPSIQLSEFYDTVQAFFLPVYGQPGFVITSDPQTKSV